MLGIIIDLVQSLLWLTLTITLALGYVALKVARQVLSWLTGSIVRSIKPKPRPAFSPLRSGSPAPSSRTPIPELPEYRPYRH